MKRKISMLLVLAMFAALAVSCGGDGGNDDETSGTVAPVESQDNVSDDKKLDLPEELDFSDASNNKIVVLNAEGYLHGENEDESSAIKRAVYNQFAATETRLGVTFEYIDIRPFSDVPGLVTQSINTQTDDYQLVFGTANNIVGLINQGYFNSINDLTHIDLDKVWWNRAYTEALSVDENNPYILFGDITYNTLERTTALFFNKDVLLERHGMTDSELYDLVIDGKWTVDKFIELSTDIYADDGDSVQDIDDMHGIVYNGANTFEYMVFSAGVEFTSRDEDGYPEFTGVNSERAITLMDKLLGVFLSKDAFAPTGGNTNDYIDLKFVGGKALFTPNRLFIAGWSSMINMEDDFGIIPMPKLDETIDGYHSVTGNYVQWGVVPTTVQELDMVSAVAESLAYEAYNRVTPTYYEENLKLKYTRGDDIDTESQMLDIIREGARTDFLYINKLGGMGDIYRSAYYAGTNNVASAYATFETMAEQTLADLIAALE